MGCTNVLMAARWQSEEMRMIYVLLLMSLGKMARAGSRRTEHNKRIWILGDVMLAEFENLLSTGRPEDTRGEGFKLQIRNGHENMWRN